MDGTLRTTPDTLLEPLERGLRFLASQQGSDGSWRGDYGGPMFLLPMYIAATYICRRPPSSEEARKMKQYILSKLHDDGSLGIHAEAEEGMMFTTVLNYVALRLLGEEAEKPEIVKMRRWILDHGGAWGAPSWAKWTLCLLNLYEYEGLHPILPELYLLPYAAPVHPGRMWCHARQVYLPMSWLYAKRAACPLDERLTALRMELYSQAYETIPWKKHRDTICPTDQRVPPHPLATAAQRALHVLEGLAFGPIRRRAMAVVKRHIDQEDEATNFIRLGPVNAVLNTLVHFFEQPGGEAFLRSWEKLPTYLWDGHDGLKMNGYNSCALWDTAFAMQAILAAPLSETTQAMLEGGYVYLRENQVREDPRDFEAFYRHPSKGGWPFSDRAHGWPITDCTAEGLKVALALDGSLEDPIPRERLQESVGLLLSFQNDDGGWASYERQRAGSWLEIFNPSQVFRDIMVDASYVECTSACIQALAKAVEHGFSDVAPSIRKAMMRGRRFLLEAQRSDGSFEGSWAVCFTYGTWFAVCGLLASGLSPQNEAIQKAASFLLERQRPDGSWGEHFESCQERRYIQAPEGHAAQTSWALLTLIGAGHASSKAAKAAVEFLLARQKEDGDWPREALVGVFNKTTLINYENYRRIFPLMALSAYLSSQEPSFFGERPKRK